MEADTEDDIYAQQLKEVFNSCDFNNKGFLNRNELIDLSQKLQLGDQVPALLTEVLGDEFTEGEVTFEAFREAFVNVLAKAIDNLGDTTEDDRSDFSEFELGESASSRRLHGIDDASRDDNSNVFSNAAKLEKIPSKFPSTRKTSTPTDPRSFDRQERHKKIRLPSRDEIVVEASGTVESLASTFTQDMTSTINANELQKVWDDIAVGESGFLNLLQLSTVCDHIGMGKMADDEIELLFNELDTDRDGLVGFDEFFTGLFASKKGTDTDQESADDDEDSVKSIASVRSLKELVKDNVRVPASPRGKINGGKKRLDVDILSSLDPNESGCVELRQVRKYFETNKRMQNFLKELTPDADGKIRIKHLSRLFERIVSEGGDDLSKSVLRTYKKEIFYLRDQLDTSKSEVNVLKTNVAKLGAENFSLICEAEDQDRKKEEKHADDLKTQAESYESRMSSREKEITKQRDAVLRKHEQQNIKLEEKVEQMKAEDMRTKNKFKEASVEILRLEENLKETIHQLNSERKKRGRFEIELQNTSECKQKIVALERELSSAKESLEKQITMIKNLENLNKELRDRNDEYLLKLESVTSGRKINRSLNGSRLTDDNLTRHGSCLSDYLKPDIVKRHFSSESQEDQVFSISDMDECRVKILEQETIISGLRRDLESVNRLLEENTSNLNERHRRELSRITEKHASEALEMQNLMKIERDEMMKHYSRDKESLVSSFEKKLNDERYTFQDEKQRLIRDYESERTRWDISSDAENEYSFKKERRKIENSFREEKEEIELSYRSQLTKLEEKIVILETDKAEMELKFLNEKAELEQQFRIERAELQQNATSSNREVDKSQKYIDYLKAELEKKHAGDIKEIERNNKKEKETMLDNMENELEGLTKKHQREMSELRRSFSSQVSEMEQCFNNERASIREGFNREKTEMEQNFSRQRTELEDILKQDYEHKVALQLGDLRKASVEERASIEEDLRREIFELSKNWQQEKANADRRLKQFKTDLELSFAEEKESMLQQFDLEKSLLEQKYKREISELQQAFSGGEAGLKGQMKEDFQSLIYKYKIEWETSYRKEKAELEESYAREKAELELSWQVEKTTMEENFDAEKNEMERNFIREKEDFLNKAQKQREQIENDYKMDFEALKDNRDKEFEARVERETEQLRNSANFLESELDSLKEQKKELGTKNQILELKILSLKQESVEINEYQREKKELNNKISALTEELNAAKSEQQQLDIELKKLVREKSTILDNSVQEITEQQELIVSLQSEKEIMQDKIERLLVVESEVDELKYENTRLLKENSEKQQRVNFLQEVENDNKLLSESARTLGFRERELEAALHEKEVRISQIEDEVGHYRSKLENMETMYFKDFEAQKEKLSLQTTAFTTEKSRYLREIQELKEHLYRASASSDRDLALKEKVFNDAKAEVINLNKKLEEKSRKIRSFDDSLKVMEEKLQLATEAKDELGNQVKSLKTLLNEANMKARNEKKNLASKSIRSDTLVTDLYLENADLMKQIANAEGNQNKAEKQVRQLTEQKRALQRVISKLCHANGITNLT